MKKIAVFVLMISLLLSFGVHSSASTGDVLNITVSDAVKEYEESTGEAVVTRRYYFLQPNGTNGKQALTDDIYKAGEYVNSWQNEYSTTPHIYWEHTHLLDPESYLGYAAMSSDADGVYYADVPVFVTSIKWNNGVDYKADESAELWYYAHCTVDIGSEYYDAGESENYPDGLSGFDNMIYVLDPDVLNWGCEGEPAGELGEWYYYYGNGCYGFTENGDESDCLRDDHNHAKLGDVDGDGDITVLDATAVQLYVAKYDKSSVDELLADVDGDSQITIFDATLIQQYVAEIISEF